MADSATSVEGLGSAGGGSPKGRFALGLIAKALGLGILWCSIEVAGLVWNLGLSSEANANLAKVAGAFDGYSSCAAQARKNTGYDPASASPGASDIKKRIGYEEAAISCLESYRLTPGDAKRLDAEIDGYAVGPLRVASHALERPLSPKRWSRRIPSPKRRSAICCIWEG